MTDTREVLSALIDGETVDADAVSELLEAPANRALLACRCKAPFADAFAATAGST